SCSKSKFGSSNWPLKNGTTSWHPAHHLDDFTFPSRLSPTSRVSFTLKRYAGLLNELNLWALCRWSFAMSAWQEMQYWSFIKTSAAMNLPSPVRISEGSKYCTPSAEPLRAAARGSYP